MRSFLLSPTMIILALLLAAFALHQLRGQTPRAGAMLLRGTVVELPPAPEPVGVAAIAPATEDYGSTETSMLISLAMAALALAAVTLAALLVVS